MNKVAIFGKTEQKILQIRREIKRHGFVFSTTNPDLVISYGGDGTFLVAERAYPGVPKILVRDSTICKKCHDLPLSHILQRIKMGKYFLNEHPKLAARIPGKEDEILSTNDFVLRNIAPTHAIRFTLEINGKKQNKGNEYIGDGVVIATPFGSTAYYNSITRKTFTKGIGIAFNNLTTPTKHLVLSEQALLRIKLTRGDALFVADNDPTTYTLHEGDVINIKKSTHVARIIQV
ncbi:NAD(+)/NADH kinase [Candidatus Woesearchaeota archaeon]|nr:NAD(+)/NADH kinase [Candidatus Woesearchaeota archaeon]